MRLVWLVTLAIGCTHPAAIHHYPVPVDVGQVVVDAGAFSRYAGAVRRDLDPANKDQLFVLAMLDALDDHWDAAVGKLDRIVAMQTDPNARIMTGLSIRVWADAKAHGGDFEAALERGLAKLPIDQVRGELEMLRTMGQVFTAETCSQLIAGEVGPHVVDHGVPLADAGAIVFQRYAVVHLVPVGTIIDRVLGAHGVATK
ncbi:MAG: hypothetical protein ABI867_14700 [Kofleriaceae bacterium]